ncbi:hypothetical protein GA0116948_103141 [Chitinophaga costaii]|uniref:Uncharacterized protein n=1 Tax=Chitinophaga costaii TaxID=1335309 RepID=A0A1C4BKA4_9BACT|nr:hypothetical protein [Chitinophaga costaii]SCC07329.1 hypothetical protein GA0116948_103141 [Chitinophaga costaii]
MTKQFTLLITFLLVSVLAVAQQRLVSTLTSFSTDNYFYDRIIEKNDFYNKGVVTNSGNTFTISPYHVLWPIINSDIQLNIDGHINQNLGYSGSETNVPALDQIPG